MFYRRKSAVQVWHDMMVNKLNGLYVQRTITKMAHSTLSYGSEHGGHWSQHLHLLHITLEIKKPVNLCTHNREAVFLVFPQVLLVYLKYTYTDTSLYLHWLPPQLSSILTKWPKNYQYAKSLRDTRKHRISCFWECLPAWARRLNNMLNKKMYHISKCKTQWNNITMSENTFLCK